MQLEILAKLADDHPEKTIEIFRPNDFYGHASLIKRYCGISDEYALPAIYPHGISSSDYVWKTELNHPMPFLLLKSEIQSALYSKYCDKPSWIIGAPNCYGARLLSTELTKIRDKAKGTLVFPVHSTHHITKGYNAIEFTDHLKGLPDKFGTVTVCLGWRDIQLKLHQRYASEGFECTTAGHMFDKDFLLRFLRILVSKQAVVVNHLGTAAFYAAAMGIPVHFYRQKLISKPAKIGQPDFLLQDCKSKGKLPITERFLKACIDPNEEMIREQKIIAREVLGYDYVREPDELRDLLESLWRKMEMKSFLRRKNYLAEGSFKKVIEDVTPEQKEIAEKYWGAGEVKTVKEMRIILQLAEDTYAKGPRFYMSNQKVQIEQSLDYLNSNRNEEALVSLDQSIDVYPEYSGLNYGKAIAFARLGQMDEAIAALKSLLSFEPEHEKAKQLLNEIMKAYASDLMERAAKLLNTHADNDAFALLNKAKSLKEPTQGLDYLRAVYFLRINQPNSVREALQEELRYFPDNEEAKKLLNQIITQYPQMVCSKVDDTEFQELYQIIHPYTMVGEDRLFSLFSLAKRVCLEDIPGNFVECGVAAGGSSALLAYIIKRYSKRARWHFAFDSFEGMPSPGEQDRDVAGMAANLSGWGTGTCAAPEASLKEICDKLGVSQIVKPVKGYFNKVLPKMRDKVGMIAFLHMDGDWYESTKTILHNLYDRIVNDGLIQVDDYGYWQGCKKAIHEFQSSRTVQFEVKLIDGTGIWFKKPDRFAINESISPLMVSAFHEIDKAPPVVPSQMSTNERFQLYYAIHELLPSKHTRLRFVEVGSWAGASLLLIHRAMKEKTENVEGFTIEPGGQPQFYEILKYLKEKVVHLRMLSRQAASQLRQLLDKDRNLPQFIFLDGSHSYNDVKQDIIDFFPLLANGGIMIFHDFLPQLSDENREAILFHHGGDEPGIRQACEELMEKTYNCEVINLPLLYPMDPTQTQSHFPIIPGVFSTIRAYRKV